MLCCPAFLVSQGAALAFWPGACASIACTGHLALLTPHILQYTREHHRPTILHVCEIQYEHRQLVAVLLRTLAFYSFSHNLQSLSSTHALPVMLVLLCWWEARMLLLRASTVIVVFIGAWIKMGLMASVCKFHEQS